MRALRTSIAATNGKLEEEWEGWPASASWKRNGATLV